MAQVVQVLAANLTTRVQSQDSEWKEKTNSSFKLSSDPSKFSMVLKKGFVLFCFYFCQYLSE